VRVTFDVIVNVMRFFSVDVCVQMYQLLALCSLMHRVFKAALPTQFANKVTSSGLKQQRERIVVRRHSIC